jgi:hypothetical protein
MVFLTLVAAERFGHQIEMWPTNLWMMFWIIVALFLILIGVYQTTLS